MPLIDPRDLLQSRSIPSPPASSFFVPWIPDLHNDPNSPSSSSSAHPLRLSAGYLPARPPLNPTDTSPKDDANLYFLLLRARHTPSKRKLIIWFNGGPGCSSFDGAMMEVGAWRMDGKGGLQWTEEGGSWNEYADILFLDQPVGTGFSYVSTNAYATTLTQAAEEVVYFLKEFVKVFPEYGREIEVKYGSMGSGVDTYLAGESFAGQYIPYTADALLRAGEASPISLKGIAIGNGFIDPFSQYGTELETMVEKKIWEKGSNEYKTVEKINQNCQAEMKRVKGHPREIDSCENILPTIVSLSKQKVGQKEMCINVYDVRLSDTSPACGMNWPPTLAPMYDYLKRPDVRKALRVDDKHKPEAWVECSNRVGAAMRLDRTSEASVTLLPTILEKGIKVMLFAGEEDLICNSIGVRRVAENLSWSGGKGFGPSSKPKTWLVNGKEAGSWQTDRNLTYVGIKGASHMVGFDVPVVSHDMILRFMEVNYLNAAGPNALIPSQVGDDDDRILVTGGGGGLKGSIGSDGSALIPGTGKTEEQVAEEARWRAYYNAGSAALVVLLIGVGVGVFILMRLRRRARMQRRGIRLPSVGGGGLVGDESGLGRRGGGEGDEDQHELDHLVSHLPEEDLEEEEEEGHGNDRGKGGRMVVGKRQVDEDGKIFDVGDDEDEDDEDAFGESKRN
ncbi:alpha/beta-hydrolase [Violaceomyces palustris]|uniref:Alpha/beta-hydrolase n=1 Tax=Violaceomyces palustris TaxID=1673888 RepID=A0ACD0NW04_9BASI|nr:alpha/beta-hydrolase [Violaceomyces palustris]